MKQECPVRDFVVHLGSSIYSLNLDRTSQPARVKTDRLFRGSHEDELANQADESYCPLGTFSDNLIEPIVEE